MKAATSIAAAVLLAGCGSITGLSGSADYACKAPEGVKCDSVSGTYYNALQNNLPAQRKPPAGSEPGAEPGSGSGTILRAPSADAVVATTAAAPSAMSNRTGYLAMPLRSEPKVLRLWIKPWEDADHDLNGESLVYIQIDNGRWMVDHAQRLAREPYTPIRPGQLPASTTSRRAPPSNAVARPAVSGQSPGQSTSQSPSDEASAVAEALRAAQGRTTPPSDH